MGFRDDYWALYERHPGGGPLHIVLDDDNVETHHIVWCLTNMAEWADEWAPRNWTAEDEQVCERIACHLLDLPEHERSAAIERAAT